MNVAILTVASLSLVCSAGSLIIMARTYKKISAADAKVRKGLAEVKTKSDRNVAIAKSAIQAMEF